MKKWIYLMCLLALPCTGCISLCNRCDDWDGYYIRSETVRVPDTNKWYCINTFTVYNATCEMLYALDAPRRQLFSFRPKSQRLIAEDKLLTIFWPFELVDLPCEIVFDTLFLPVDIYYQNEASDCNEFVKARYGIK